MKKILHISKYYYPFRGGIEQVVRDSVQALSEQYEHKVICFNHQKKDETDFVDDVEVIRCGCFAKISSQDMSFSYGKKLKKVINEFEPDMIIFHYPNPFVARYLLKYIKPETKLVLYWHLDIVKQKVLRKLFINQNYRLLRRADKIVATSPIYIEGSKWLFKVKEKCCVIPNCINTERLQLDAETEQLVEKIKTENSGKTICMALGRHTEYKGFTYLIKAAKELDDNFKIFIAGKGELTDELKAEAEGDSKVQFLGLVSDMELKAYLNAMDIFCFPSITKNEAFGIALAEAMYYGKPAVTFTIPGSGVNYVSINNETGIEVPNRDVKAYAKALNKLRNDVELRNQYGINANKRVVENFLYSQFVENINELVSKL